VSHIKSPLRRPLLLPVSQLSSLLLIKTLISTRWKPRGGCVRKKVVQVGADDIASQEIPPELTPATKNCLRATLISFLACPPPLPFTTAVKNSINAIVAKVGRSDLASDFPALLPTLLQSLHGNIFTTNCLNKLLKEVRFDEEQRAEGWAEGWSEAAARAISNMLSSRFARNPPAHRSSPQSEYYSTRRTLQSSRRPLFL